ncbi:hypothetical protein FA15DRAFT_668382 [Coprinopsis marcescibilis]|uniref:Uncharacterized protein n=1 Tax=Coprinopsis marcescibilis TaxID=230819 RepID=A0A5C3KY65_COPMA|nr:hypothetical protein FA15DRAFT_668382 [Coprinopsis marcescibilis]
MTVETVRTRTFCCCIPVRVGVILLALLGLIGGGLISAVSIIALKKSQGLEKSMALNVAAFIILSLVSLLGLIGGIARKLILVRIYFGLVIFQLAFSFAGGIYAIYRVFQDTSNFVKECELPGAENPEKVTESCNQAIKLIKGLMITAFILVWFLQVGACVVVHRYGKQLEDEEETRSIVKDTETW